MTEKQKEAQKKWGQIFFQLISALHDKDIDQVPEGYVEIYQKCLEFLPEHDFMEHSLSIDILNKTDKYFFYTLKINHYFEENGFND